MSFKHITSLTTFQLTVTLRQDFSIPCLKYNQSSLLLKPKFDYTMEWIIIEPYLVTSIFVWNVLLTLVVVAVII